MATPTAANHTGIDKHGRRKQVEAVIRALGRPVSARRSLPPEGRLGSGEDDGHRLRTTLIELGPVFAGFGRYLAARFDLLPRRIRTEMRVIPDEGRPLPFTAVKTLVRDQLGAPIDRLFFEFHETPFAVTTWTERHLAWLAPGVPAMVTIVRPDASEQIDADVPLLCLLAPWIDVTENALVEAVDDYQATLRRRLDQRQQASSLATVAAEARNGRGFSAPACYRDHCASGILTVEQVLGETLEQQSETGEGIAGRLTSAWLWQALSCNLVPYDFDARDVVVTEDRLLLTGAAFEPNPSSARAHFAGYVGAVAADDPDAAAGWLLEGADASARVEDELRRRLRQAVPFRDGEWSGDDRLAEHMLVQWRVANDMGWSISSHHQHLYNGLETVAGIADRLAPNVDTLLGAFEDERLRIGVGQAGHLLDPQHLAITIERAVQELVELPQKLDDVLTMASEGRLRLNLQVPETDETEHVRNRTVLLVTTLVAFAGLASMLRHLVPVLGLGAERVGAVVLLIVGGWLLIAAARL
jgi:predicted unusual protein kinase regulating ubiquinone biosynthesis (AarF/ABC1/UbiB family)